MSDFPGARDDPSSETPLPPASPTEDNDAASEPDGLPSPEAHAPPAPASSPGSRFGFEEVADNDEEWWRPRPSSEGYTDVPASLELSYTAADMGLGPRAFERTYTYEELDAQRRRRSSTRYRRVGRELVETVVLALLIFFAVKALVQNFRVEGNSMEPSMHNDQYLLVNKAIYYRLDMDRLNRFLPFIPGDGDEEERHLFRAPRRGDVVVFRFPLDPSRDFIKRVIGVPGDTVEVRDETVFINGAPLEEDYILSTPNYTYGPKTVPAGMYYVLGDNRRNSFDSHAWGASCSEQQQCDFVPEENIIGQAWLSYWPFDELGLVNNDSLKPSAP